MFEAARDQVVRSEAADRFGIRHHIDPAVNFGLLMADEYGGNAEGHRLFGLLAIAQNNAVSLTGPQQRPQVLQAAGLPVKRPWTAVIGVIGNPTEQRAP